VLYGTLAALPQSAIRAVLRLGVRPLQRPLPPEQVFWRGYFRELIARLTKADYLSRVWILIDFDRHYRLSPADSQHWSGPTLILEADDDPLVSKKEALALRALYPEARVHTFHQTAHAVWMTRTEEYLRVIETFLEEPACRAPLPLL